MKALAAIALTLAFATPASAATVAHRTPAVGPVFAGDSIVWGEPTPRGAALVMQAAPGREPVLVHRVPPATARKTERSFSGVQSSFAASASGFAALVSTATVVFEESDSVSTASTDAVLAGPWHGPVSVLSGCIPASGDDGCPGSCDRTEAIAVDGARTALATPTGLCDDDAEPHNGVTILGPAGTTTVPGGIGFRMSDVELAGRLVAWIETSPDARDTLVVHDLVRGVDTVRMRGRDLHARTIGDAALQPDGTVAVVFSGRRDRRGGRLGLIVPGVPGVRVIERHVGPTVAIAAGRLLHTRVISERRNRVDLVLRSVAGGAPRVLSRLTERRRLIGDFDLDAARATWAEVPARRGYDLIPRGPGRIVVRDL